MAKILIVEDDPIISKNLKLSLEKENHLVETVADGAEGLYLLLNYSYDLAILDWQLPGKQGSDICVELKNNNKDIPILMLTSRSSLSDRVLGLDSGAYDYVVKPCDLNEINARVRALARRPKKSNPQQLIVGNLVIDLDSHEVYVETKKLRLSPSEFELLQKLCRHLDEVVPINQFKTLTHSSKENVSTEQIRVQIASIRKKLSEAGAQLQISNARGLGYVATLAVNTSEQKNT